LENNIEIAARLDQFRKSIGMSMNEFGKDASFASGGMSKIITSGKSFGVDKLMNIFSKFPELNADWLLFGKGEMLKDYSSADTDIETKIEKPNTNQNNSKELETIKILYRLKTNTKGDARLTEDLEKLEDVISSLIEDKAALREDVLNIMNRYNERYTDLLEKVSKG